MSQTADFLLRRLRLRHLQLLALLDSEGSLRAAAQVLHLSQPAVSKMLNEIEQAFDGRLFERGRRGVQPSDFGRVLIHHARIVLGEVERAASEVEAMRGGATATLRLGTLSVTNLVPAAIVLLLAMMPGARVRIREGAVHDLLQQLRDGELDCVFGAFTTDALAHNATDALHAEPILDDHLCALVSARHPLARARKVTWAQLADGRWVAPPRAALVRQQFIAAYLHRGLVPPDPVVETMSPVTVFDLLRRDPTLIAATRFETTRLEVPTGLRRLALTERVELPPLCILTRHASAPRTAIVENFAHALRGVASPDARRRGSRGPAE